MSLHSKSTALCALVWAALAVTPARGVDLASYTGGTTLNGSVVPGQSFTVTGAGSFTNISFNFFSNTPATTPFALGTAFLLSSYYSGTAAALSSGTAGYLGQATASGGFYNFGSGVTLNAGTQYYLYTNTVFNAGSITAFNGNGYAGGILIVANGTNFNFDSDTGDFNFRVTGNAVGAPEGGSTAWMLALGVVGLWIGRRSLR